MWKLYYHDGTTFSSEDGDWLEAPALGVMGLRYAQEGAVTQPRDTNDFYVKPPWTDTPWGADHWGVLDLLVVQGVITETDRLTDLSVQELADAGVKLGRSVSNKHWQAFMRWMDKDEALPPKTAWYVHERR